MEQEERTFYIVNGIGTVNEMKASWVDAEPELKAIGNYFDTYEEARKAFEKLKAWKSLKDKGFKFTGWELRASEPGLVIKANCVPDSVEELDILFGGEE